MKVSELEGARLDYFVARAEGERAIFEDGVCKYHYDDEHGTWDASWRPSTDWAIGGPLIERRMISVKWRGPVADGEKWRARTANADRTEMVNSAGPTPLTAAMRCLVIAKMGEEVEG